MKCLLFFLLLSSQFIFAQKGSKRSDGDLLNGTWKCVKCRDTTIQSIAFEDTIYRCTNLSPEGLKITTCPYTLKNHKIFIRCDDRRWKYRISLIDHNSLELKQWKKGTLEFRKT